MKLITKNSFSLILLFTLHLSYAQIDINSPKEILSFEEYMAYVKQFHPVIKQASLSLSAAEAKLLKSRGAFDPVLEADYSTKKFKDVRYYDKLNALFKIPTWFGIELKANFEENSGQFLNPESTVPAVGLYSAGVSLPLAKNLLINDRMATLKRAKIFRNQTQAERTLLTNQILYEATIAYLNWYQAEQEKIIYQNTIQNAEQRFNAVVRTINLGQEAAIDSVEAKINLTDRKLGLEQANLKFIKAKYNVANYIWINGIPLELEEPIVPAAPLKEALYDVDLDMLNNADMAANPKLQLYDFKLESLEVNLKLKRNNVLPTLDFDYNFLSPEYNELSSFNTDNYKFSLNFKLPIFLRKERGDLRLSTIKLNDSQLERDLQEVQLKNKIEAIKLALISLDSQLNLASEIVKNYQILLAAEERKFFIGESSLFLVNLREQKWIDSRLKEIELDLKRFEKHADYYNTLNIQIQLIQY